MTPTPTISSRGTALRLEALPDRRRHGVRAGAGETEDEFRRAGRPPRRPEPAPPALPRNLVDVRVLVVDDDETTLDFLAAALGFCGAQVTTAQSTTDALIRLERVHPDVVLSDIAMPGHDGYWLVAEIRKLSDAALSRVPVVATTAYGRVHSRERTQAAGFVSHLTKPVDPDVLCRTIASAVGR